MSQSTSDIRHGAEALDRPAEPGDMIPLGRPRERRFTTARLAVTVEDAWFDERGFRIAIDGETVESFHLLDGFRAVTPHGVLEFRPVAVIKSKALFEATQMDRADPPTHAKANAPLLLLGPFRAATGEVVREAPRG